MLIKYTPDIKLFPLILPKGTELDFSIKERNSEDFVSFPLFPKLVISTDRQVPKIFVNLFNLKF